MSDAKVQRLLARTEIQEVLARYVRGIDRANGEMLKSCYHPDAIEEHAGNYTGNAHEYVGGAMERVKTMGVMQHLLGSSHIEFSGDKAWVETNLWTFLRCNDDGKDVDTITGGRIIDRFEKRDGDWKIAHRRTILDWNRDTGSKEGWCLGLFSFDNAGALRGSKNSDDPSYERF